ncbi:hypothetical protein BO78DRAFT_461937 [Aspergillus sclerotiicarbonarius CBS 121057]|uniref:Class I glutamine amidotransferase-like protein n=1 Tax=Aspergillus sclerotiicarbonarius (strain CBS 121057 / IBT 28362) TaxID=1448318 RepID=A0A319FFA1_ASPSB|nr:hypothetical protein BO78DRAFT_461937 [Aspergillus sclerotiicarbonarius CBS 121057]
MRPKKKTIHIAILDVDVPVPNVYTTRGLYSTQFHSLLTAASSRLTQQTPSQETRIHTTAFDALGGQLPSFSSLTTTPIPTSHSNTNTGKEEEKERNEISPLSIPITAILITGSVASVYDPSLPWVPPIIDFVRTVYERYPHVKIFGSCFGHQLIAHALLSNPPPTKETSNSSRSDVRVECCPLGMEVGLERVQLNCGFVDAFPCLNNKQELKLQMIHGDWVSSSLLFTSEEGEEEEEEGEGKGEAPALPAPWLNVGSTDQCPIQGLYCPGRVLSYQGHFEFDSFVNRETCVEFGRRLGWKEEMVKRYVGAIGEVDGNGDDSKLAAEVVVRFLAGEDEGHTGTEKDLNRAPEKSIGVGEWVGGLIGGLIGQLVWSTKE